MRIALVATLLTLSPAMSGCVPVAIGMAVDHHMDQQAKKLQDQQDQLLYMNTRRADGATDEEIATELFDVYHYFRESYALADRDLEFAIRNRPELPICKQRTNRTVGKKRDAECHARRARGEAKLSAVNRDFN